MNSWDSNRRLQAMRLAGLSDEILLAVADHRAGKARSFRGVTCRPEKYRAARVNDSGIGAARRSRLAGRRDNFFPRSGANDEEVLSPISRLVNAPIRFCSSIFLIPIVSRRRCEGNNCDRERAESDRPRYSQAIRANGFIFTAGQVAFDPATGQIVEGTSPRKRWRVLENLKAIVEAAGSSARITP